jgi:hypothetical protein
MKQAEQRYSLRTVVSPLGVLHWELQNEPHSGETEADCGQAAMLNCAQTALRTIGLSPPSAFKGTTC